MENQSFANPSLINDPDIKYIMEKFKQMSHVAFINRLQYPILKYTFDQWSAAGYPDNKELEYLEDAEVLYKLCKLGE